MNEKKSKVRCLNGEVGRRRWKIRRSRRINIFPSYGGRNGGFKSMGDRMRGQWTDRNGEIKEKIM